MKKLLLIALAASLPVLAEEMRPNKDPVPSPSDLATERPRVDAGGTTPVPAPSDQK